MAKKTYSEKLKDPRWQRKRLEVLNRDDWRCVDCMDNETTLHVHHKYYEYGKDPWEYESESLITLCENCHKCEEIELEKYSKLMIDTFRKAGFRGDDMRRFAHGFSKIKLQTQSEVVASAYEFAISDPDIQSLLLELLDQHVKDLWLKKKAVNT